ncbi:hypothetical protein BHM03_00030663 [Ensete ventricosum]|nr:hypothetical protein BHM03_00030663 [Ensete ventricosum]
MTQSRQRRPHQPPSALYLPCHHRYHAAAPLSPTAALAVPCRSMLPPLPSCWYRSLPIAIAPSLLAVSISSKKEHCFTRLLSQVLPTVPSPPTVHTVVVAVAAAFFSTCTNSVVAPLPLVVAARFLPYRLMPHPIVALATVASTISSY